MMNLDEPPDHREAGQVLVAEAQRQREG